MMATRSTEVDYNFRSIDQLQKYFWEYEQFVQTDSRDKILHFSSSHLNGISKLLDRTQIREHHEIPPVYFELLCEKIKKLTNLKLTCERNRMVDLKLFVSLEQLHLVGRHITSIRGLRPISSQLKSLIVEDGNISMDCLLIKCLADESKSLYWPCLLALQMSHCRLTELDPALKLLPNLKELDLSYNDIKINGEDAVIPEKLSHLNLSFNKLNAIPPLRNCRRNLKCLYLAHNEISTIEWVEYLGELLVLDVSYNLISNHDTLQVLGSLINLKSLNLLMNPLCCQLKHRDLIIGSLSGQCVNCQFLLNGRFLTSKEVKTVCKK